MSNVAELLARAEAIESPALRAAIVAAAERISASEELARLRDDVPLATGIDVGPVSKAVIPKLLEASPPKVD